MSTYLRITALLLGILSGSSVSSWVQAAEPQVVEDGTSDGSTVYALRNDGQLLSWGSDLMGQLGVGRQVINPVPAQVVGLSGVRSVAAGSGHALAAKSDGTLWAWGSNGTGQLGIGSNSAQVASPVKVNIENVSKVAAGEQSSFALTTDGTVWSWGAMNYGLQGDGTQFSSRTVPAKVPGLSNIQAISSNGQHAMALGLDGAVWAWGYNAYDELGVTTSESCGGLSCSSRPLKVAGLPSITAILAAPLRSVALASDGTVWFWGMEPGARTTTRFKTPQVAPLPSGMIAIAASDIAIVGLRSDGTVWVYGQFGNSIDCDKPCALAGLSEVAAISFGQFFGIALKRSGGVWGIGSNYDGAIGQAEQTNSFSVYFEPTEIKGLTDIAAVSTGQYFGVVTGTDGSVWTWGNNTHSELGTGSIAYSAIPNIVANQPNVVSVDAGQGSVLSVLTDGSVWGWGGSTQKSLPTKVSGLPQASAASLGGFGGYVLAVDGTVWSWSPWDVSARNQVPGLTKIRALSSGGMHTLALRSDGTVWAWGYNNYGQLGDRTTLDRSVPVQVSGLSGISAIAAGHYHSLALGSDGSLWAWGSNMSGELGIQIQNPNTNLTSQPIKVPATGSIAAIAAGMASSTVLKNDGSVWRLLGQYLPYQIRGVPKIATLSRRGSFGVAVDGVVWGWGFDNLSGQRGNGTFAAPTTSTRVVNEGATGYLSLTGAALDNTVDPYTILQIVGKTPSNLNTKLSDLRASGFTGDIYFTALLPRSSPLVRLMKHGQRDVGAGMVPMVFGRSGFKQTGPSVAAESNFSGPISSNAIYSIYEKTGTDPLSNSNAIICMGLTVPAISAKGQVLMRSIATGDQVKGVVQCPTVQTDATTQMYVAASSGPITARSISASIIPREEDRGQVRNIYSWAVAPDGTQFMQTGPNTWAMMAEPMLAAMTAVNVPSSGRITLPVLSGVDLSSLVGTLVYVGMGSSWEEVRTLNMAGHYYTIQ